MKLAICNIGVILSGDHETPLAGGDTILCDGDRLGGVRFPVFLRLDALRSAQMRGRALTLRSHRLRLRLAADSVERTHGEARCFEKPPETLACPRRRKWQLTITPPRYRRATAKVGRMSEMGFNRRPRATFRPFNNPSPNKQQ
jgi:hypothetical protein